MLPPPTADSVDCGASGVLSGGSRSLSTRPTLSRSNIAGAPFDSGHDASSDARQYMRTIGPFGPSSSEVHAPHDMLIRLKTGGLAELRCTVCEPPANAYYRKKSRRVEYFRGVKGLASHIQHSHPDISDKFDSKLVLERCVYHVLSEDEVRAAYNGGYDSKFSCQTLYKG
jgi:hypothetical protein